MKSPEEKLSINIIGILRRHVVFNKSGTWPKNAKDKPS